MGFPLDLLFEGPASTGGSSACPRGVFLFALLFLASIISSSDVYDTTTTANPGDPSYATTDVALANATSSTHTGALSTAVTSSIGAEVVEEFGCADTEFRLTCRELDSTIAILDARFHPFDGAINIDPVISMRSNSSSANDTMVTDSEPSDGGLPCPAPKEWVEAEQWARTVGPDGSSVVDPSAENDSFPWPLQPGPGEYHFRLALNHRCSGVNHCSFILASDFEEAGRSWGPGAVRIRYACMRQGHHVVRYCNEDIVAGATTSKKSGDQWRRRERRRRGRGGGGAAASKRSARDRGGDGEKERREEGDAEEKGGEVWTEGEGFIASPGYPKYYIGGGPIGDDGERKACEWMIRPRQPGQRVQVTLLDVSLRGVAPLEQGCSDWVEVTAVPDDMGSGDAEGGEERVLLTGCGEAPEAVKIESPEDAPGIRVALLSNSGALFPKRGILFHYKALGCRWPPPTPPKDGYLVSRNSTVAQYMCCVGFKFPDSGLRERELYCDEQRGLWRVHVPNHKHFPHKLLIPDCIASGRPSKEFESCSERSKRRKVQEFRGNTGAGLLAHATCSSLLSEGKTEEVKLLTEALFTSPTRAKKINTAWKSAKNSAGVTPYAPQEALSLIIEADLSKNAYQTLRSQAKSRGADLYPSYKRVKEAKLQCCPHQDTLTVTDTKVDVKLQILLDLTVSRLIELQREVVCRLPKNLLSEMYLVSKWGCDGSGNHSLYKQISTDKECNDSDLFMICLVPLQLYVKIEGNNGEKTVVWQNPRPSSTRYCRPVKLEFVKETTEVIKREKAAMDEQIKNLQPTTVQGYPDVTVVKHELCMTMVDGKVANAVTGTVSSQSCYMCGATSKDMNDIEKVMKRDVDRSAYQYGLSTLHAYIRFLEWLIHVAARLETKSWQKKKHIKDVIDARESEIQSKFRSMMGLLVGVVKQGKGNTNDGNTARRFFENAELSASITGISASLIQRCDVILRTLSCGFAVDSKAFHKYAIKTARLYVSLYEWYPMPASVHKVLIHGSDVISVTLLPIGMLSEEAQESRNKDLRRYREKRCRKFSRTATNLDLMKIMMVSSDPIISSLRKLPPRKSGSLKPEVLALLVKDDASSKMFNDSDSDD